ncbi:MAG: hypothetical protein ACNYPH_04835 [Gammaproteobacteria bacterium WSBS_2016_MAG_OTU1]
MPNSFLLCDHCLVRNFYTSQYADIIPAEESRTKVIADNDVLMVGDRKLNILYTLACMASRQHL